MFGCDFLLTHAGLYPAWSAAAALAQAAAVEAVLQAPDWASQLAQLWDGHARLWQPAAAPQHQQRFAINAMLRMRFIAPDGGLDFALKENALAAPPGYNPWFAAPLAVPREAIVVFGHWSALGLVNQDDLIGLDTGCVWGNSLSALRLLPLERVSVTSVE